jgi:hypothetical protein
MLPVVLFVSILHSSLTMDVMTGLWLSEKEPLKRNKITVPAFVWQLKPLYKSFLFVNQKSNVGLYSTSWNFVGFEVFTAVTMKNAVFWVVAPCRACEMNRRFGGTHRLHLQGRKIRERGTSWNFTQRKQRTVLLDKTLNKVDFHWCDEK